MSVASSVEHLETFGPNQRSCHNVGRMRCASKGLQVLSSSNGRHRSGGAGGPKNNFPIACMEGNRLYRVFWTIVMCRKLSTRPGDYQGGQLGGWADDLGSNHAMAALHWLGEGGAGIRARRSSCDDCKWCSKSRVPGDLWDTPADLPSCRPYDMCLHRSPSALCLILSPPFCIRMQDVKRINVLLSKTECYKVGNKPLFLLGLVSLAEPVETLWRERKRLRLPDIRYDEFSDQVCST